MADAPPVFPLSPSSLPWIRRLGPGGFVAVALATVFLLYQIVGGILTWLLFDARVTEENVQAVRAATLVSQGVFLLLPTLLLVRAREGNARRLIRMRGADPRHVLMLGVAVLALQQVAQSYMALQDLIPVPPLLEELLREIRRAVEETYRLLVTAHSLPEFLFVVLVVALTPALCEELLFRGLVQGTLEIRRPGMSGPVIAGILFALFHLNPFALVPLCALGVFFGYAVHRTGSVLPAVFAHFLNNFLACAAVYVGLDEGFLALAPGGDPPVVLLAGNALLFGGVFAWAAYLFTRATAPARETAP
ncbi:MAG: CPBP family intramembrane glutamic endopeptidase [Bacteroidota bacterium]